MRGDNPIRKPVSGDGSALAVKSIFATIQGEGPAVGTPSVFIRLGGCNLACTFCDTDFEDFKEMQLTDIIKEVQLLAKDNRNINYIVITGGEPLRQPISRLCDELLAAGYMVQIETNGTLYQKLDPKVEIVCSPKVINGKYHKINPQIASQIFAYKFLISKYQKGYDATPKLDHPNIYLQPMDEYDNIKNRNNSNYAIELAQKYGYKLSVQIHKILGIE